MHESMKRDIRHSSLRPLDDEDRRYTWESRILVLLVNVWWTAVLLLCKWLTTYGRLRYWTNSSCYKVSSNFLLKYLKQSKWAKFNPSNSLAAGDKLNFNILISRYIDQLRKIIHLKNIDNSLLFSLGCDRWWNKTVIQSLIPI